MNIIMEIIMPKGLRRVYNLLYNICSWQGRSLPVDLNISIAFEICTVLTVVYF